MDTPLFATENLIYGHFLSYPDLTIQPGLTTFLVGASGSGKTTLLRLCNGSLSPSQGQVLFRGQPVLSYPPISLRRQVSLVSQEVFLFDDTLAGNFRRFYAYRELPAPSASEMEAFLHLCCLDLPLDKAAATCSGGERQRLYMAIFLSFRPQVLLLDEPTAALDAENAGQVMTGIVEFCRQQGMETVIVCHNPAIVAQFSQQTVYIGREAVS